MDKLMELLEKIRQDNNRKFGKLLEPPHQPHQPQPQPRAPRTDCEIPQRKRA